MTKLQQLAEIEGYPDTDSLVDANIIEDVVPGICTEEGCDYTCSVEPDSEGGYCEVCLAQTVKSCLVLAGII
jgi:hypothetical protein